MGFFDSGILGGLDTLVRGTNADKVYGKKPIIPSLPSLSDAQKTAVQANNANFEDIAKLAASTNTFNQDQLNALIDKTLGPGVRQQIQDNLASQARGEIPQDVQNAIFRGTASRSAQTNAFGGGGFTANINARDLGLTSLDITNKALSSAEQWLAQAKAPTFNAASMFLTPEQQNAANLDQFNAQLLANKVAAAPDPSARGQFDSTMSLLGMVLSAYGGGPGYQNTYHPEAGIQPLGSAGVGGSQQYLPQYEAPPQGYQSYTPYNTGFDAPSNSGGGGLGGLAGMFA